MTYSDLYATLKREVEYSVDAAELGCGLGLRNFDFHSRVRFGMDSTASGDAAVPAGFSPDASALINRSDAEIEENRHFRYHMFLPPGSRKAKSLVFFFHGFNEKNWHKYLPWAAHIAARSGHAVLMFPIAFHMNRAPALWSDMRAMNRVSKERRRRHPDVINSTLSNVAISTRLHNRPDRFVWSGLESYHDVIDLVGEIKAGGHPAIEADAAMHFFSYSVGSFLGEIIMMTDKDGYFANSRYALFCGGPVFNRLSPVSKFILDSEANVKLYSYLVEHLDSHMKNNPALNSFFGGEYPEGVNLASLLNYRLHLRYREEKFRAIQDRLYAVALAGDAVVPPYEVVNTLKGSRNDIAIRVDIDDFPYPYRHEDPFPANGVFAGAAGASFRATFDKVAGFLAGETNVATG